MKSVHRLLVCLLFFLLSGIIAFWETNFPLKILSALEIIMITFGWYFLINEGLLTFKKLFLIFCAGVLVAWLYLESGLLLRIVEIIMFGTIFLIRLLLKRNNSDINMMNRSRNYKLIGIWLLVFSLFMLYAYFTHYIDSDFAKLFYNDTCLFKL